MRRLMAIAAMSAVALTLAPTLAPTPATAAGDTVAGDTVAGDTVAVVADGDGVRVGEGDGEADELWRRTYRSVSVTEHGEPRDLLPGTRIRLELSGNGGLNAGAGCGRVFGTAATDGDVLVTTDVDLWFDGCADPARQGQDVWLAAFLSGRPTWRLDGHELTLARGGVEIRLTDAPTVAEDPALAGTHWVIEAVVLGDGGLGDRGLEDGVPEEVRPAPAFPQPFLELRGDVLGGDVLGGDVLGGDVLGGDVLGGAGYLYAFNSCNWYSGGAAATGDTLTLTGVGSTKRLCADTDFGFELLLDDALDDGELTYRIAEGRLYLTRADGPGLVLRSES